MKMEVKVMKMMLVLCCCALSVSADELHEELAINGCSDSDGEFMYGLDGEELWYADFVKQEGVDPQPSFLPQHVTYVEGMYQAAVTNQQICRANLKVARVGMKDILRELDGPSSVMLYIRNEVELGKQNSLVCHVSGFYPAPVQVEWRRNGAALTTDIHKNVPIPDKDGSFTQASTLRFVPQLGDVYSCSVQHPALEEPITKFWEVEVQSPSVGPSVFCGLGLSVGLVGVATGTFFLIKGNECS